MEKLLQEELKRFNAINKYTEKLLSEQEPQLPPPPPAAGADPGADPGALPPAPPAAGADPAAAGADPTADLPPPEAEDAGTDLGNTDPAADDSTEEIDITDLVNMTKSIKKQLDDT